MTQQITGTFHEEGEFITFQCEQLPLAGFGKTRESALAMFMRALDTYVVHSQPSDPPLRLQYDEADSYRTGIAIG